MVIVVLTSTSSRRKVPSFFQDTVMVNGSDDNNISTSALQHRVLAGTSQTTVHTSCGTCVVGCVTWVLPFLLICVNHRRRTVTFPLLHPVYRSFLNTCSSGGKNCTLTDTRAASAGRDEAGTVFPERSLRPKTRGSVTTSARAWRDI